jgi:hypothetical protein
MVIRDVGKHSKLGELRDVGKHRKLGELRDVRNIYNLQNKQGL